uniref:Transcriptional regulator n=1 Tax=Parastrongyloides trichosuri TaxID=131310 RepID=A0A0N4ZJ14_PARTI
SPRRLFGHAVGAADIEDAPTLAVGQAPEMIAPVQIGAAVLRPRGMAQQTREMDQRRRVQLDQIGRIVQAPHPRRAPDQIEAVQIVVGDDALRARVHAALHALQMQQNLFGADQIDRLAQQG